MRFNYGAFLLYCLGVLVLIAPIVAGIVWQERTPTKKPWVEGLLVFLLLAILAFAVWLGSRLLGSDAFLSMF